jgi:hypothetical protein
LATIILYVMGKMDYLTFSGTSLAISDISLVFACGLALVLLVIYFWPYKSAGKAVPGALGSKTAGKSIAVEQTAEQASEQASVVINAIDDGVIAVDSKGTIHLINPAAQKMIGWTGGDALNLIYKSVLKLVDSKDQPVSDAIDPVLLTLNTNTTSESDSYKVFVEDPNTVVGVGIGIETQRAFFKDTALKFDGGIITDEYLRTNIPDVWAAGDIAKNDPDLDKPEIAVEFARLLMAHERFKDAQKVIRTALEEGPRYDLYELRAASTHSNLEELWKEVHEKLGTKPERTSVNIYNEGLKTPDPDWKAMLSTLDGN